MKYKSVNATKFHLDFLCPQCKDNVKYVGNFFYGRPLLYVFFKPAGAEAFSLSNRLWEQG